MRAILTSFGSTGDAQPFLALATELRRHGHQPIIALSPYFAERVQRLGFPFVAIGAESDPDVLRQVGSAQINMSTPAEQVKFYLDATLPMVPQMFQELRALCQEADVLISTPFQFAADRHLVAVHFETDHGGHARIAQQLRQHGAHLC